MAALQKFLSTVAGVRTLLSPATVGGAGSAGQVVALNTTTGLLDVTMMPSGIGPNTQNATASEAIAAGALVNLYNNSGSLAVRNADNTNTAKQANGFVLSAISNAASGLVYLSGIITGLTGLTAGTTYYLGTVGGTVVAGSLPTATGTLIQAVGTALSATTLEFNPGDPTAQ